MINQQKLIVTVSGFRIQSFRFLVRFPKCILVDSGPNQHGVRHLKVSGKPAKIEHGQQLVEYLESGCKPKSEWRLGTEHEKFGFTTNDLRPLPYEGKSSIRAMLEGLANQFGWKPVKEQGKIIALLDDNGASVTLEPGGQLELSGALLDNIHQTCDGV